MRNRFDSQLEELNKDLISMGALCEKAIGCAAEAIAKCDPQLAAGAIETEKEIDAKERMIETLCMRLLLQQQPVASDLRLISAALKMITDMERIGDQSADIAEIVPFVDLRANHNVVHIGDMAESAIKMVTQSVDAFVKRDLKTAQEVISYDDIVDDLFSHVKSDLITLIENGQTNGEEALDMLMIAKYMERIGDHATNIAEWVAYAITGEHGRPRTQ